MIFDVGRLKIKRLVINKQPHISDVIKLIGWYSNRLKLLQYFRSAGLIRSLVPRSGM